VDKLKVKQLVNEFNNNGKSMKELAKENNCSDKTLSRYFSLHGYYYNKSNRKFELGKTVIIERPQEQTTEKLKEKKIETTKIEKRRKQITVMVDIDVYAELHMLKIHESIQIGEFVEKAIVNEIEKMKEE
jgi:hypothetical protein